MKIVVNKLTRPLRVPLPQGKVLHLGPRQKGQIADHAVDHEPLQALVEDGSIEVLAAGAGGPHHAHGRSAAPHERTHGLHPRDTGVRGDR